MLFILKLENYRAKLKMEVFINMENKPLHQNHCKNTKSIQNTTN